MSVLHSGEILCPDSYLKRLLYEWRYFMIVAGVVDGNEEYWLTHYIDNDSYDNIEYDVIEFMLAYGYKFREFIYLVNSFDKGREVVKLY